MNPDQYAVSMAELIADASKGLTTDQVHACFEKAAGNERRAWELLRAKQQRVIKAGYNWAKARQA